MSTTAPNPPVAGVAAPEPLSMGAVLRIPVLRRLWVAQIISTFGDFLALFAVIGFLTFRLHATPQQVTGLQIAYTLPIALLGIVAGVFVDRWPLKPTLVASDLCRAGLCCLLLLATTALHFYAILAAISIFSSFFSPAQGVAIRSVVPMHGLRSANALMQQVLFGMRVVGPSLATLLYTTLGPHACYMADALSFVGSATLIATLALVRPTAAGLPSPNPGQASLSEKQGLASIVADMKQGLGFIFGHAALLFVILALAAGMFVLGCFGPLIAVYVRDSLHQTTKLYGIASSMIGVGMFLGINVLNTAGKRFRETVLVYGGLGGIALGLVLLAAVPHVWATLLANLIIGCAVAGIIVPSNTLVQQETPAALMGRVGSTMMSLVFSAQIGGLLLSGLLANHIGVRHVFALCAVLLAVLMAAGKLWMEPKTQGAPIINGA